MAKITTLQSSLNAGELSPDLAGHIDLDRYANGVKTMVNAVPQIAGGGKRRDGSRQVAPTKTTGTTRLVPFVFSKSQAYVLELGNSYARFYSTTGQIQISGVPIELATPWTADDVFSLEYTQGSDTMFVAHPASPIKRLVRVLQSTWQIDDAPFDPVPMDEIGVRPAASVTLSVTGVGASGTAIASAGVIFHPADVGRNLVATPGVAAITGYVNQNTVNISVTSAFSTNGFGANDWKLDQSPMAPITPSNKSPVDGGVRLVADGPAIAVASVSLTGTTMTLTSVDPHGLSTGQTIVLSGFESAGLDGTYAVASTPTSTTITFAFNGSLLAGGTLGTMYLYGGGDAFRPTDVGNYVSINGGLVEITSYGNGSTVLGRIVKELSATITAPANGWTMKSAVWNAIDGYPNAVSLYQQRLYAAGTAGFPDRFWASSTGLYLDFTPGTDDADSFSYVASSDQVNEITHLTSASILAVLTQGEEFTISAGSGNSVSPTNISVKSQSVNGTAPVRPVRVGNELVYIQRAAKKVRSMTYDFNTDSFRSANLTRLASHITGPGIVDMAFQAEPNPVVWMVRSDGVLVSMTYDRDDNVCGFARHTTDGLYKSVAVIPGEDGDVLFAVVQRTVGGITVQNVEQFDPDVMTDAAIIGTAGTPAAVWTGLGNLEGKACDVKADGVYMGTFTVTAGQITLPRNASSIEVGLHYDSEIVPLTPNISGGLGTSQGNQQRTGTVILRFLNTIRCLVDGQVIPFRAFGEDVLDQAPQPFTGDKDITEFGWDKSSEFSIKQDQPYPWHILAVIRQFTVNNG
ncbi:hypothetical protein SAMN04487926_12156 [Paraburkholderia steynii]|uniref:Ubiquitin-activating enzyme E1 FCCH domain-containing protein n=1 Tax=Paraburkholderia steynii TaxID=1245441 RepID=A0A7Z7BC50_9BURK|nr:hypothetical protein [Paraburkholderia steynii]SDI65325.1 hypothetical protein SAMN04487926_12156 [Paraburkholderia steynii]